MPHIDWNMVLSAVVAIATVVVRHAIVTPSDQERAALLRHLADDAAAVIVNLNPTAPWAQKVKDVVARLSAGGASPTANTQKIESAATAALVRLGHTQDSNQTMRVVR